MLKELLLLTKSRLLLQSGLLVISFYNQFLLQNTLAMLNSLQLLASLRWSRSCEWERRKTSDVFFPRTEVRDASRLNVLLTVFSHLLVQLQVGSESVWWTVQCLCWFTKHFIWISNTDNCMFHRGQLWNWVGWVWVQSLPKWSHLPWFDWLVLMWVPTWVWRHQLWNWCRWVCQPALSEWSILPRHGKQVSTHFQYTLFAKKKSLQKPRPC